MAEVQQSGGEEKKGKPKKQTLRVDFTPMVDMNMLLITFFMFCTTLSKPQIMDIAMPTDQKLTEEDQVKYMMDAFGYISANRTIAESQFKADSPYQPFVEELQYAQARGPLADWPSVSDAISLI